MRSSLMAGIVLAMLSAPAFAWDAQTSGSGPQAIGQDGGSATAQAQHQHQTQHQSQTATGGTGGAGGNARATGGRGGNSTVSVSSGGGGNGSGSGGVYFSIPDGRGEAPCGGGVGLGGGGSNAGGGVGGTLWEFADCKRMRESAALDRLGYHDAAVAELCQIDRVREAFGGKCPESAKPHLALDVNADKPDYCFTRNAGDKNQHRECDRFRKEW